MTLLLRQAPGDGCRADFRVTGSAVQPAGDLHGEHVLEREGEFQSFPERGASFSVRASRDRPSPGTRPAPCRGDIARRRTGPGRAVYAHRRSPAPKPRAGPQRQCCCATAASPCPLRGVPSAPGLGWSSPRLRATSTSSIQSPATPARRAAAGAAGDSAERAVTDSITPSRIASDGSRSGHVWAGVEALRPAGDGRGWPRPPSRGPAPPVRRPCAKGICAGRVPCLPGARACTRRAERI